MITRQMTWPPPTIPDGKTVQEIAAALHVNPETGLSDSEVQSLGEEYGPNALAEGKWGAIPSNDLVPGDIVGADLRFIRANRVQIDESVPTGESVPSDKTTDLILSSDVSPGDQPNRCRGGISPCRSPPAHCRRSPSQH